jgi:hypothetical protein
MEKVHKNDASNNKPLSKCFSIYLGVITVYYDISTEYKYTVGKIQSFLLLKQVVHIVTIPICRVEWQI